MFSYQKLANIKSALNQFCRTDIAGSIGCGPIDVQPFLAKQHAFEKTSRSRKFVFVFRCSLSRDEFCVDFL